jgi:hypothetical protein
MNFLLFCATPFVIGVFNGRLGNQLFNVATTYTVAWDHNAEACFPQLIPSDTDPAHPGNYSHVFFRCNPNTPTRPVKFEMFEPPGGYRDIPYFPDMKIVGWYQSEKYFARYRDRLLELLAPHPDDLLYIQNKYGWILNHPHAVGISIREWYEDPPGRFFIQYGKDYLRKAMPYFDKDAIYIVTSNNMDFAKANIPEEMQNVYFIEWEPHYIQLYLHTLCKHNVVFNSTFSWWEGWLNKNPNKIVIAPDVWFTPESQAPPIEDLVPDDWIKLSAKGGALNNPESYQ